MVGDTYTVTLAGPETQSTQVQASATAEDLSFTVTSGGVYTVRVTGPGYEPAWAETEITVTACDIIVDPCDTGTGTGAETKSIDGALFLRGVFGEGENDTVIVDGDGGQAFAAAAESGPSDNCDQTPVITVQIGECLVDGDDSSAPATFQATGLKEGESYEVTVSGPSGFAWTGTITGAADGTGSAVMALGGPGTYTATIAGGEPIEFISTVSCSETTPPTNPDPDPEPGTKTPQPSTPPTAKPVSTPGLAVTGSASTVPFAWMGFAALLAAAGLMVAPKLTRRTKR